MNKIYKVIWSKARNCYVVVSELAKCNAKGGSSRGKTPRILSALLLCACLAGVYGVPAAYAEDEITEAGVAGTNVTRADFSNASAWGNGTVASGSNSTAWGLKSKATGTNSTAWGLESQAIGNNSTAFGSGSVAKGMNSLAALGGKANAMSTIAIGSGASADGMHSIALGMEATADLSHAVAIGSYSVANRAAGAAGYVPDGSDGKGAAWVATQSAIAIGASANDSDTATVTRQITGVAAGTYDTDAVNVAQLKSAMQNSGKTYTAGDGIVIDDAGNKISVKSGDITTPGADGFAKAAAVYTEIHPHSDGKYVKKANSAGLNLAILDKQLEQTVGAINTEIANRESAVSGEAALRASADEALSRQVGSLSANGKYIRTANDVSENLAALDTALNSGLSRQASNFNATIENMGRNLSGADEALGTRIDEEAVERENADNYLSQLLSIEHDERVNTDEKLEKSISSETTERKAADTNLGKRIDTETAARTTADTNLGKRIDTEVSERKTADTNLGNRISTETSERKAEDTAIRNSISSETNARTAADTALSNRIGSLSANGNYIAKANDVSKNLSALDTQLKTTATGLQTEISDRKTAVSNEATARAKADTALSDRIGTLKKDGVFIKKDYDVSYNLTLLDDKVGAADRLIEELSNVDLATLEVIAEAADVIAENKRNIQTNTGDIINLNKKTANIETALNKETSDRTAADTALGARIDTEKSAREAADKTLENSITKEVSDRTAADKTLETSIKKETSDRTAADKALGSRIDTEASERKTADTALGTRIDNEASARTAADKALESLIANETSARGTAEQAMASRIDKEATDREAADKKLETSISKEASDRAAEDKALGARIDSEAAARAAGDKALSDRIGTLAGDGGVIQKDNSVSDNLALLDQAIQEQAGIDQEILEQKAEADASNVGKNANGKDNSEAWGSALGTGAVESKNGRLVTGSTVFNEVRTPTDGAYVKAANTAAANLTALDAQMKANTDSIAQNAAEIGQHAADIAANQEQIGQNTADIAANAKDIAANREDIKTNAADIATNKKNIAAVKVTADNAMSGVSMLIIGTGLNVDEIIATDKKVQALEKNNAVIAEHDYKVPVKQDDGTTKDVYKSQEFVKGYTVYEYLNGKPGEDGSLRLGQNSTAVSIGKGSSATGKQSLAIGFGNKVTGNNSGAFGDPNTVTGTGSYALGNNNTIGGNDTFVLGSNVEANVDDAVVLGNKSTAEAGVVSVGSAGGERQIKHVKEGTDDTDAATWGQVKEQVEAVNQNTYNNDMYLNNRINRLDSKVNKVGAGAAALAALHPIDMDNKFGMGLGYGNYRNASAMSMGLFYRPQDNLMFSFGGSMGNGENMVNAGVTIALDKGISTSKAVMARNIRTLSEENAVIREENATMKAQLNNQEEKLNSQEAEIRELKKALADLAAKVGN